MTIFTCGVCAVLSDTGGHVGIKRIKPVLKSMGVAVIAAKTVPACCSEEIMRQAVRINGETISRSDALLVASCAAGVKSAFLCEPGVPVVAATDTLGSAPISRKDNPVALSVCNSCGHCVITHTGGICPVTACPSGRKYEPCQLTGENGNRCVIDPDRACVWLEIEKRGDLSALKELQLLHERVGEERLEPRSRKAKPVTIRRVAGWVSARSGWFHRLVSFVD